MQTHTRTGARIDHLLYGGVALTRVPRTTYKNRATELTTTAFFTHVCILLRRSVSDALLLLRTFLRSFLRNTLRILLRILLRTLLRNLRLQCLYGWVILQPTASVGPSLGEDVLQSQWQTNQVLQITKLQGLSFCVFERSRYVDV
jgi:hypothetical protein